MHVCFNRQVRENMWAKPHFSFMKDPLPFNVLLLFKAPSRICQWHSMVFLAGGKGTVTNCRKSQNWVSEPGPLIEGPVNSYFPCIHEAIQDPPRLGGLQSDDTSDLSAGTDGEERVFCLTGGITGVLAHHKSCIQFANRTTNSPNH